MRADARCVEKSRDIKQGEIVGGRRLFELFAPRLDRLPLIEDSSDVRVTPTPSRSHSSKVAPSTSELFRNLLLHVLQDRSPSGSIALTWKSTALAVRLAARDEGFSPCGLKILRG